MNMGALLLLSLFTNAQVALGVARCLTSLFFACNICIDWCDDSLSFYIDANGFIVWTAAEDPIPVALVTLASSMCKQPQLEKAGVYCCATNGVGI